MPVAIEKSYAEALFDLITEVHGEKSEKLTEILNELEVVGSVFESVPEMVKYMSVPAIPKEEKQELLKKAFEGKVSKLTFNFIRVLADKGRVSCFGRIYRQYVRMHNELFGITIITVTSAMPLDNDTRNGIIKRMEKMTEKTVKLNEKIDKGLIGGIVIDYDGKRLDGSVKTHLDALKYNIAETIM